MLAEWAQLLQNAALGEVCRLRLAPTPSGFLHLGNAVNFALNSLVARAHPHGRLLLRIDDLDADRKRPEYVEDIFETLHWLGIRYDEGPRSAEDFDKNWSQQLRIPLYNKALQMLRDHDHLFGCAKSRRDLAPFGGEYPPAFRAQNLSLDAPDTAWRLRTPPALVHSDVIVRRRDGVPAYQIASLVDDVLFGVTHIVRGEDLRASSDIQTYLAGLTGQDAFGAITIWHHPLLTNAAGKKLSKSAGDASLKARRGAGESANFVWDMVQKMVN